MWIWSNSINSATILSTLDNHTTRTKTSWWIDSPVRTISNQTVIYGSLKTKSSWSPSTIARRWFCWRYLRGTKLLRVFDEQCMTTDTRQRTDPSWRTEWIGSYLLLLTCPQMIFSRDTAINPKPAIYHVCIRAARTRGYVSAFVCQCLRLRVHFAMPKMSLRQIRFRIVVCQRCANPTASPTDCITDPPALSITALSSADDRVARAWCTHDVHNRHSTPKAETIKTYILNH